MKLYLSDHFAFKAYLVMLYVTVFAKFWMYSISEVSPFFVDYPTQVFDNGAKYYMKLDLIKPKNILYVHCELQLIFFHPLFQRAKRYVLK